MFRTLHAGCCKSITEFYASHARDGENSMRNERLDTVPERLTITWVDIRYCTFDDRSEAVPLLDRLVKNLLPMISLVSNVIACLTESVIAGLTGNLYDPCLDGRAWSLIQHCSGSDDLLSHDTGRHNR